MSELINFLAYCKSKDRSHIVKQYSGLNSRVPSVMASLKNSSCLWSDTTQVRNFVLDCLDFVSGSGENSRELARETDDLTIYETMKAAFFEVKDRRVEIIDALPNVGKFSALCILSFLFPHEYVLLNKYVIDLLQQYEDVLNIQFSGDPEVCSDAAVIVANQMGYESALDFSIDLRIAVNYIVHRKFSETPRKIYCVEVFELKFYSVLLKMKSEANQLSISSP